MSRYPMTPEGLLKFKEELKNLKSVERPRVIEAIAEARGHGDISENAEYDAAKEQQAFLERRIRDMEEKIANAQVVDPSELASDKVVFGVHVTVRDMKSKDEFCYRIVGEGEADISENRISVTSPVARALIGKRVGDLVQVMIPKGMRELEIVDIALPK